MIDKFTIRRKNSKLMSSPTESGYVYKLIRIFFLITPHHMCRQFLINLLYSIESNCSAENNTLHHLKIVFTLKSIFVKIFIVYDRINRLTSKCWARRHELHPTPNFHFLKISGMKYPGLDLHKFL